MLSRSLLVSPTFVDSLHRRAEVTGLALGGRPSGKVTEGMNRSTVADYRVEEKWGRPLPWMILCLPVLRQHPKYDLASSDLSP
jgi:hypothetical protein